MGQERKLRKNGAKLEEPEEKESKESKQERVLRKSE